MLLCTTALFSSAVPELRLLETNLGTSAPMIVIIKYPCESRFIIPLAPGPNWSMLLPSFSETEVTSVHVPTSSPPLSARLSPVQTPIASGRNAIGASFAMLPLASPHDRGSSSAILNPRFDASMICRASLRPFVAGGKPVQATSRRRPSAARSRKSWNCRLNARPRDAPRVLGATLTLWRADRWRQYQAG
jgi:hypothetical protein